MSVEVSKDQFIGGGAYVLQPLADGHRSGMDAVFLAAAIPSDASGVLYDLGAGTGAAGFCAAARAENLHVKLVERDDDMLQLAKEACVLPENARFAERIDILSANILMPATEREEAGLVANSADWVIANPPFYLENKVRSSPNQHRREAHVLEEGDLETWFRLAAMLLKPGGRISLIHKADALSEILRLCEGRFGGLVIRPIHPRVGKPANRLILSGQKGSRGVLSLLPGFNVHDDAGNTPHAAAILRHGKGFADLDKHL
ncbi:MAG: methyltransferase [Hyphomicrobiales bacterium]